MDGLFSVVLPKLGESIVSATVVRWCKKEGDLVALDEPLVEVSTDKVNSEIPSPVAGRLRKIVVRESVEVEVGASLALIETSSVAEKSGVPIVEPKKAPSGEGDPKFLSPAVLRLLSEKGIALSEIEKIPHTGEGGRLTKKDVEEYRPSTQERPEKSFSLEGERSDTERVKMSSFRKAIADNMVRSFYEAPHASLMTEVDVTKILQKIEKEKGRYQEEYGAKLSITSFVAKAISETLRDYPHLNASLEGDTIVVKRYINLGIAVSVDQGVMVPVVRNANALSLAQIAQEIGRLAKKAREHKLLPEDVQRGTLTLTNFGMTGTLIGVPIIRYPEVAIVGMGAIQKKVVVVGDDAIAIRSCMWISLTFDHRVLDGLYGCGFLGALKKRLEEG